MQDSPNELDEQEAVRWRWREASGAVFLAVGLMVLFVAVLVVLE